MMAYSCSLIPKQVDVIAKPIERQIAQPILPRELQLKAPYWYVVSNKNVDMCPYHPWFSYEHVYMLLMIFGSF